MNRILLSLASLLLITALQAQQPEGGKEEAKEPNALQPIERFNNRQMTLLKNGKPVKVHVTVRDWQIHGRQKIGNFPEGGLRIVFLHSGTVTAVIGGKEEKHLPGDYWNVPAGTSMGIQVTSESATLHIVAVGAP